MTVLGYEWLRQQLALSAFEVEQPARVRPVTRVMPAPGLLAVPAQVAPLPGDVLAHVLFALKHEGTNLQVLAQAMPHVPVDALQAALRQTPNGRYVRVLAYLWEAFMGQRLADQPEVAGRYVDVFDPAHYVTGPAQRDARWRVNFNGLGSLRYCATVRRTPAIAQGIAANWLERTAAFLAGLGPAVQLLKMAHEGRPLTEDYLAELQSSTVSHPLDKAAEFRTQQNWLRGPGRGAMGVTYVPPWPDVLPQLMQEWMHFANAAPSQLDPIVAASVVSFGFVFLHPFMDGNGRLSRFLFHKALCASGRLPKGQLLPVSVAMKRHEAEYLAALQSYSCPARERVQVTWIDEGEYLFDFKTDDAIYRFWDATPCVEFGFAMAEQALNVDLKQETVFLAEFDAVTRRVNEQLDIRNNDLATLTIICLDNGGVISNKKRNRYADRVPAATFDLIEAAVRDVRAQDQEREA